MNVKKILYAAIEKLVREKPVEKITVQEILDEAEVSRRTFYKYFSDKYDLANSLYESYVSHHIRVHYNGHNWADVLTDIVQYIYDNLPFYESLWKFRGQGSFFEFMSQYSFDFYSSVYKHNHSLETLSKEQEYDLWFITGGNMKILDLWMEDQNRMPIAAFIANIMNHTPKDYYEYTNRA